MGNGTTMNAFEDTPVMLGAGVDLSGVAEGEPEGKKRKKKRARWEDPVPDGGDAVPDFPSGMTDSAAAGPSAAGPRPLDELQAPGAMVGPQKPSGAMAMAMDDTPVVGGMGDTPVDAYATPVAGP